MGKKLTVFAVASAAAIGAARLTETGQKIAGKGLDLVEQATAHGVRETFNGWLACAPEKPSEVTEGAAARLRSEPEGEENAGSS